VKPIGRKPEPERRLSEVSSAIFSPRWHRLGEIHAKIWPKVAKKLARKEILNNNMPINQNSYIILSLGAVMNGDKL
jgi:hypothetical protein